MKSFLEHLNEEKKAVKKLAKKQDDNDKVYKDWRKNMPDLETTRKIVGEEQQLEDYDAEAADQKRGKLYGQKIHKKDIKDDPINASWHKRVAKGYEDEAKRLNKKAVTRLDEEEQQLDELHGKSIAAMDGIMKRIPKIHDEKWEKTHEKRTKEKLKGSEKTKEEDKERNYLGKRWKRAYVAKKKLENEKKLEESEKDNKVSAKEKPKKDLFARSRRMIVLSKLDRNRERNKDNRED